MNPTGQLKEENINSLNYIRKDRHKQIKYKCYESHLS